MKYISKEGLSKEMTVTEGTIDGWRKRHWKNGHEYIVKGHTGIYNREEVESWLDKEFQKNQISPPTGPGLELSSGKTKNSSTPKPCRVMQPVKLYSHKQKPGEIG